AQCGNHAAARSGGDALNRWWYRRISGERGRNRTFNLLIKSQLLCQLSYAPACEEKLRKTKENYSRAIGDCFRCRGQEWCSLLATPAQVVASKLSRRSEHMPGIISTSAIAKGFLLDGQWISGGA